MSPEDDSDSSCNSDDALLDLLGLDRVTTKSASLHDILDMTEEREESSSPSYSAMSSPWSQLHKTFRPIALPAKCSRYGYSPQDCAAVVVEDFCSALECQRIVQVALHQGPCYITEATHTAADGTSYSVPLQNPNPHKLAVFQHSETITLLERRIMQLLKPAPDWLLRFQTRTGFGRALRLNPRIRVIQYDACDQDRFEPHFDATTVVQGKPSCITVLLYLNTGTGQDFSGGDTLFLDNDPVECCPNNEKALHYISPRVGRLVLFEHDLYHSSSRLEWGTKYVLRTDIVLDDASEVANYCETPRLTNLAPTPSMAKDCSLGPVLLLVDLCRSLQWSQAHLSVLEDMGVLTGTLDTFLVPGRKTLTQMLLEGGIPRLQIDILLTAAIEHQNNAST
jgi:hypothetical protein